MSLFLLSCAIGIPVGAVCAFVGYERDPHWREPGEAFALFALGTFLWLPMALGFVSVVLYFAFLKAVEARKK